MLKSHTRNFTLLYYNLNRIYVYLRKLNISKDILELENLRNSEVFECFANLQNFSAHNVHIIYMYVLSWS